MLTCGNAGTISAGSSSRSDASGKSHRRCSLPKKRLRTIPIANLVKPKSLSCACCNACLFCTSLSRPSGAPWEGDPIRTLGLVCIAEPSVAGIAARATLNAWSPVQPTVFCPGDRGTAIRFSPPRHFFFASSHTLMGIKMKDLTACSKRLMWITGS